jgi:hypothetical protein
MNFIGNTIGINYFKSSVHQEQAHTQLSPAFFFRVVDRAYDWKRDSDNIFISVKQFLELGKATKEKAEKGTEIR